MLDGVQGTVDEEEQFGRAISKRYIGSSAGYASISSLVFKTALCDVAVTMTNARTFDQAHAKNENEYQLPKDASLSLRSSCRVTGLLIV